jgi:sialic acid synthase SpsE/spore coat polysaccharide biosynthesis protein SpsF (cytidylyltransferase family)
MSAGRVVAVVQARMGSTRLSGKVLRDVAGRTILDWVLDRLGQATELDEIVVATSVSSKDDVIEAFCRERSVTCFRGSEDDVLGRFEAAAQAYGADVIVRVNADNPLVDPRFVDVMVNTLRSDGGDYISYRRGDGTPVMLTALSFFTEALSRECLDRAYREIDSMFEREHVTLGIYNRPDEYDVRWIDVPPVCNNESLRLTLDTPEDLTFLETFLESLGEEAITVDAETVVASAIAHPEWLARMSALNNRNPKTSSSASEGQPMSHVPQEPVTRKNQELPPLDPIEIAPGRFIGDEHPCLIIAEVGQNHNGSMEIARELIDNIAFYKADAVKLCKRHIPSELTKAAYDRPYIGPQSFGETYGIHREFLELSKEQYAELKAYAESKDTLFFSTACDMQSVDDLESIGISFYKVASRDLTNLPLIDYMASTGKPIILSRGMDELREIKDAVDTVRKHHNNIVITQCTSRYPTPYDEVNIRAMKMLRREFDVLVGMSDHTIGVMVPVVAAALGAVVVEKHVTLARHMKGTDHACSLEPDGLRRVVRDIRNMEMALGDGLLDVPEDVAAAKAKLARSLVSKVAIPQGTVVTEDMLCLKSPGGGILWRDRGVVVGKAAKRDIPADVTLEADDFADAE